MEIAFFKVKKIKIKLYFHDSTNLSCFDVQNVLEYF